MVLTTSTWTCWTSHQSCRCDAPTLPVSASECLTGYDSESCAWLLRQAGILCCGLHLGWGYTVRVFRQRGVFLATIITGAEPAPRVIAKQKALALLSVSTPYLSARCATSGLRSLFIVSAMQSGVRNSSCWRHSQSCMLCPRSSIWATST
jgi:hypothetical protein